jgi:hypothetical protein
MQKGSYTFVRGMLLCLALALLPQALAAQVFTPTFMGPRQGGSLGVYISDFDPGDLAVEGIYRQGFGAFDLGLRGGIVDAGGTAFSIGAEYRNALPLGTAPIDISVTGGAQALIGEDDADWLGLQAGLTIGGTFRSPGLAISPYVHPRIGFMEGPADDGFESDLLAEIGADFDFSTRLAIRLAIGLDDTGADWGIGLAWR